MRLHCACVVHRRIRRKPLTSKLQAQRFNAGSETPTGRRTSGRGRARPATRAAPPPAARRPPIPRRPRPAAATMAKGMGRPAARPKAATASSTLCPRPRPRLTGRVPPRPLAGEQEVERREVPARQVDHVDIVPDRRPVRRRIVVAVDRHPLPNPRRGLGDVGKEVVRHPARVLPDQPRGMRADRVEVAQRHRREVRPRRDQLVDRLLDHELGAPVGVDRRRAPRPPGSASVSGTP